MRHMSDTFSRFTREGPNLTTQILQDLGRAIVTGRFSHGNTFPFESELCQQYSASRPVVREAVKMLTTKGLLVAVLEASNNRFFRQFTDLTEGTLRFSIRRTNAYKGVPRASAADHKVVADAIVARDPPRARDEMFKLIEGALDLLLDAGGDPKRPV